MSQLLHKVRFDTKTTTFDPAEERYWLNALKGDPIIGQYIRNQMRNNPQYSKEIFDHPVCSRCEKLAFHHKGGVQCPSCNHWSPEKTHKIKTHIAGGYYR